MEIWNHSLKLIYFFISLLECICAKIRPCQIRLTLRRNRLGYIFAIWLTAASGDWRCTPSQRFCMRCLASSGGGVRPEAFSPPARDVRRDLNNLHGRQNEIKRRILGTKSISRAEENTQNLHCGWVGVCFCAHLISVMKALAARRSLPASDLPFLHARCCAVCAFPQHQ
jgi:hypothetical protein